MEIDHETRSPQGGPMKLNELMQCLNVALANNDGDGDVDVEVWQGDREIEIESIGQFGIVKDVVIYLKEDEPTP
jgi:hypothetical protein